MINKNPNTYLKYPLIKNRSDETTQTCFRHVLTKNVSLY